jgi:hypothetical protein
MLKHDNVLLTLKFAFRHVDGTNRRELESTAVWWYLLARFSFTALLKLIKWLNITRGKTRGHDNIDYMEDTMSGTCSMRETYTELSKMLEENLVVIVRGKHALLEG